MIPTTTYDQVRLEQANRLAHLERRQHARAAREMRPEPLHFDKVRPQFTARRAVAAVCAIVTATAALLVL